MVTHWEHTRPKARKEHRCSMCHRVIEPGETYMRGVGMGDGTAWTWKECAHCEPLVRLAYRRCGDQEYDYGLLDDFEPLTIAEARVRAQYRRRWRRFDGALYPTPALTITEDKYGFGWPTTIAPGGARMTDPKFFTLTLCDECNRPVDPNDCAPSCGVHLIHVECREFFACRWCDEIYREAVAG